jgi:hypothetical protein
VAREPHHHPIYEDARVSIVQAEVEARDATLLHRHDADYVWVALGDVQLADTVPGRPATRIQAADGSVHFKRGGFDHVTRNENSAPFHIIAVDLRQPQTSPKNVCGEILAGEYLHCHEPGPEWLGVNLRIEFETDQTHIGILEIAPGATLLLPPADIPPVLIALQGVQAEAVTRANGASPASGLRRVLTAANVLSSPADQITEIRNTGPAAARFLVIQFGGGGE